MKIAICFSGQLRTGLYAAPNIKRFIGDLMSQCDFFMHTWDVETHKNLGRTHLNGRPIVQRTNRHVPIQEIELFTSIFPVKQLTVENFVDFRQNNSVTIPHIAYYTSEQSLSLRRQHEIHNNFRYDMVIKMRPDIIYGATRRLEHELGQFTANPDYLYSDIYSEHRLDDVFWIMNSTTADKFSGITQYLNGIGKPDPSPSVLEWLNMQNIQIRSTARHTYQYAVYRYESLYRDPLTQYREIFRDDILYYSMGLTEQDYVDRFSNEDALGINYD